MKKLIVFFLVVFVVAWSCKDPVPPTISVEPASYEGVPALVSFMATGTVVNSKAEISGYSFVVTELDGTESTFFSADGTFSHLFKTVGAYRVSATVAESSGIASETPALVEINVLNPFDSLSWALGFSAVYQDEAVTFNAGTVVAERYEWLVFEKTADSTLDTDGDGYKDLPLFSGAGATCIRKEGFLAGEGYKVLLTIIDSYENEKEYTTLFDVLSQEDPNAVAVIVVDAIVEDLPVELIVSGVGAEGVQPIVYEKAPLKLRGSGSAAGSSALSLTIDKVYWDISLEGAFLVQLESSSTEDLVWTPEVAGNYSMEMRVENNLGKEDIYGESILAFTVSENKPVVTSFSLSVGPHYEGKEISLTVDVASQSSYNGKIVKLLWDIDGMDNDISWEWNAETEEEVFSSAWTPYYFEELKTSLKYEGNIIATNQLGRESAPFPFVFTILDNNPKAVISLVPESIFWGSLGRINLGDSGSAYGEVTEILTLVDESQGSITLIPKEDSESGDTYYEYSTPLEGTGTQIYTATLMVTNINGSATVSKKVTVLEPALVANFEVSGASGGKYFSNQRVVLNASNSKSVGGSGELIDVAEGDFEWTVTHNGLSYASGRSSFSGPLSIGLEVALFNLELGDSGLYEIKLKVYSTTGTVSVNVVARQLVVVDNTPYNLGFDVEFKEEVTVGGKKMGRYSFRGWATSPDGIPITTFEWFNNVLPTYDSETGAVVPSKTGKEVIFDYEGGSQTVYMAAINSVDAGSVIFKVFETEDYFVPLAPTVYTSESDPTNNPKPSFSWVPEDAEKAFKYWIQVNSEDAGSWVDLGPDVDGNLLTQYTPSDNIIDAGEEGEVTLYVQTESANGNRSESGMCSLFVDRIPPVAPVFDSVYPDGLTNQKRPTWKWTPANGAEVVLYRVQLDGLGEWEEQSETEWTPVADLTSAPHILAVQVRDQAGNWGVVGEETLKIDLIAPEPPVVTGFAETNDETPMWSWSDGVVDVADPDFGYRYQFNAEESNDWVDVGVNVLTYAPLNPLLDGNYYLYVQARDRAGNWSESGSFLTTIDTIPPAVPSIMGENLIPGGKDLSWAWNSVDSPAEFRYQVDAENANDWITTPVPGLGEDSPTHFILAASVVEKVYSFYVQARDSAGNWSASASFSTIVDKTPPALPVFTADCVSAQITNQAIWYWDVASDVAAFRYRYNSPLDSSAPNEGWTILGEANIYTVDNTTTMNNTLDLQARDLAGNWSETATKVLYRGEPEITGSVQLAYQTGAEILGSFSIVAKIGEVDITSILTDSGWTQGAPASYDEYRKVGDYTSNFSVTDQNGTVSLPKLGTASILPPNAPVVINGDFESSIGANATGWQWVAAGGYCVKGTWSAWSNTSGGIDGSPAAIGGEFAITLGSVVDCTNNINMGGFNVTPSTGVDGPSKAAFMASGGKTADGSFFTPSSYVSRTRGRLEQRDILVYKDVTYTLTGKTWLANGANKSMNNSLKVSGDCLAEPVVSPASEHTIWVDHSVDFTPTVDGVVAIEFSKSDISGGNRDAPGSYFDDAAISVTRYPTK